MTPLVELIDNAVSPGTLTSLSADLAAGDTVMNTRAPASTKLQAAGGQFRASLTHPITGAREIVIVTGGRDTAQWVVTRGDAGTTPTDFPQGTIVRHILTADAILNLLASGGNFNSAQGETLIASFLGSYSFLPKNADNSSLTTGNAIRVDSQDRALIAGETVIHGTPFFALCRINKDMTLDTTFGDQGWWLYSPPGATSTILQGVAVGSDGSIFVSGGYVTSSGTYEGTISKITPAGLSDTTFAGNGTANGFPPGSTGCLLFGVAVQADGKPIGAGVGVFSGTNQIVAVRFNLDGSVDTTYGASGYREVVAAPNGGAAWGISIDSSGRAMLGGEAQWITSTTVLGVNPAGATVLNVADTSGPQFVNGATIAINSGNSTAESVIIENIVSTTQVSIGSPLQFGHNDGESVQQTRSGHVVARLTTAGALDTSYNGTGYNAVPLAISTRGLAIDLDSTGKAVVAGGGLIASSINIGGTIETSGNIGLTFTKYNTDGTFDTTFGSNGYAQVIGGGGANGISIDAEDNIVAADIGAGVSLTRVNKYGVLDENWGVMGQVLQPLDTKYWMVPNGVRTRSDGRYVLGGISTAGEQSFASALVDALGQVVNAVPPTPPKSANPPGKPTIIIGSGLGTSPPVPSNYSSDIGGAVFFGTGLTPSAGILFAIQFSELVGLRPWGDTLYPAISIVPANDATFQLGLWIDVYYDTTFQSMAGFRVACHTPPAASVAADQLGIYWGIQKTSGL